MMSNRRRRSDAAGKIDQRWVNAHLADLSGSASRRMRESALARKTRDRREQRASCKSARGVEGRGRRKPDTARDDADLEDAAVVAANEPRGDAPERSSGGKAEQQCFDLTVASENIRILTGLGCPSIFRESGRKGVASAAPFLFWAALCGYSAGRPTPALHQLPKMLRQFQALALIV